MLPAHFDLVATQSPIRNQGHRGVCSIFATTALMEHLYLIDGTLPNPDFSEQFLQWSTKVESGAFPHTSGSNARTNLDNLRRYGTVMEADAPYQSSDWGVSDDPRCTGDEATQPTECFTNGTPSAAALAATRWFVPSGGRFISTAPNSLEAHMVHTNTAVPPASGRSRSSTTPTRTRARSRAGPSTSRPVPAETARPRPPRSVA